MDKSLIAIQYTPRNPNKLFHISWMLNNICNYHCSYCPDDNHRGDWRDLGLNTVIDFTCKVIENYKSTHKGGIALSFTGGEPTLWKDFGAYVKWASTNKAIKILGMTTNGSRTLRWWMEHYNYFDWLAISYHSEFTNNDEIFEKIKFLHDKCYFSTRIMMHPINWDKCIDLIERIKTLPVYDILPIKILDNFGLTGKLPRPYTSEQLSWIESNAHIFKHDYQFTKNFKPFKVSNPYTEVYSNGNINTLDENNLISTNQNNFENWQCYMGMENLFVEANGNVRLSTCAQGEFIGHISDEILNYPTKPTICNQKACICGTDIMSTKRKFYD